MDRDYPDQRAASRPSVWVEINRPTLPCFLATAGTAMV